MFQLPFVPTRLAPVPLEDGGGLLERDGQTPLRMHLPAHAGGSEVQKRQSLPLVFWHQLYPLLPPLHLAELDLATTADPRSAWQAAVYTAGYQPSRITLNDYHAMVGSKGLFGTNVNPLVPVIEVARSLNDPSLLRHHITAVALQYYLIARRAWLETRVDADAPFSERLPSHIFVTLKSEDWCYGGDDTKTDDAATLDDEQSQLAELAQSLPFPRFLRQVLTWVQRRYPNALPGELKQTQREDALYCNEKLRKNFVQTLTCMRFREWRPVNYAERTGTQERTPIKFFARPKSATIRATEGGGGSRSTRLAQFFTHVFFAPDQPVVRVEEGTSPEECRLHLLWRLLCFFPLVHFGTHVNVHAKRELTTTGTGSGGESDPESEGEHHSVFPVTARDKWQLYEGFMQLNPIRARYTFFFSSTNSDDERAYVYVPNLHLPEMKVGEGILPVDESDVRYITQRTFTWLVARGQRLLQEAEAKAERFPPGTTAVQPQQQLSAIQKAEQWFVSKSSVHNSWLLVWSYMRLFGNEEMAYAMVFYHYKRTLIDIQSARQTVVRHIEDLLDHRWRMDASTPADQLQRLQQLQDLVDGWNRCHPLPAPSSDNSLLLAWHLLFPPTLIGFGSEGPPFNWYSHWTTAPVLALVRSRLAEFRAKMQSKAVLQELRQCPHDLVSDDLRQELQQVARLMPPESECRDVLMDLSA